MLSICVAQENVNSVDPLASTEITEVIHSVHALQFSRHKLKAKHAESPTSYGIQWFRVVGSSSGQSVILTPGLYRKLMCVYLL